MDSLYLYNKHVGPINYEFLGSDSPSPQLDLRQLAIAR